MLRLTGDAFFFGVKLSSSCNVRLMVYPLEGAKFSLSKCRIDVVDLRSNSSTWLWLLVLGLLQPSWHGRHSHQSWQQVRSSREIQNVFDHLRHVMRINNKQPKALLSSKRFGNLACWVVWASKLTLTKPPREEFNHLHTRKEFNRGVQPEECRAGTKFWKSGGGLGRHQCEGRRWLLCWSSTESCSLYSCLCRVPQKGRIQTHRTQCGGESQLLTLEGVTFIFLKMKGVSVSKPRSPCLRHSRCCRCEETNRLLRGNPCVARIIVGERDDVCEALVKAAWALQVVVIPPHVQCIQQKLRLACAAWHRLCRFFACLITLIEASVSCRFYQHFGA